MTVPLPIHEEHGEVVATWRTLGYRDETVVCFDRHLDLKPLSELAARRIRDADGDVALRQLNRPLPVREAPGAYGLDDFFAAGPVLGTVRTLWWVMSGAWPNDGLRIRAALRAVARIPGDTDTLARTRVVDGVLSTRLCGLELEVHSLETLQRRGVPEHARIDVDLDWLADGDAPPDHTVDELATVLNGHACSARLDSLTWSVRSGFLADSWRWVARRLADATDRTLAPVPREAAWPVPARTFAALRGIGEPSSPATLRRELEPLGAIGIALEGCLAVKEGAIRSAEEAYWRAQASGVRSSWLAHDIGVAWRAGNIGRALEWLDLATGPATDTLEVHAATLAVLCLWQLGEHDEARRRIGELSARHPLHGRLARIGASIAADDVERAAFLGRVRALDALAAGVQ